VPQETATSTPEAQSDAPGAEGYGIITDDQNPNQDGTLVPVEIELVASSPLPMAENIYSGEGAYRQSTAYGAPPPDPIQEAKAKAEELLRRLNAPSD
jgi:hypothetical protein